MKLKHHGECFGSRSILFVNKQHRSAPCTSVHRNGKVVAFTKMVIVQRLAGQHFNECIRRYSAAVVSLVDDESFSETIRKESTKECRQIRRSHPVTDILLIVIIMAFYFSGRTYA